MNTQDYIALENRYGATNYKPLDVVLTRGQGIWVWDVDGNHYMDCLSAYSAVNQGHCHPKIAAVMREQIEKLTLTSRAFRNDQLGLFYEELCELTHSHIALPMNSGAEAVESCIKAVRKWGYKVKGVPDGQAEIIVCENNFHGRTITIVGFSTEEQYRDGYAPFTPGFKIIPFGDAQALEEAITPNTVAFMVEPIQGEAGIIIPPAGYLRDVRAHLHRARHRAGHRRDPDRPGPHRQAAGRGARRDRGRPDHDRQGALGRLLPGVGGAVQQRSAGRLSAGRPRQHIRREPPGVRGGADGAQGAGRRGDDRERRGDGRTPDGRACRIKSPHIKEVRGKGLLIGLELHPEAGGARRFCEALMVRGLLCKETHQHVIRLAPPLVITKDEVDWALEHIEAVLMAP